MTLKKIQRLTLASAVKGDEPGFPGFYRYGSNQLIAGLPPCTVPETSYMILRADAGQLVQMLTVGSDGIRYGWDMCGTCALHITRCECRAGLRPPGYIVRWLQWAPDKPAAATPAPIDPELRARVEREPEPVPTLPELNVAARVAAGGAMSVLRKRLGA